MKKELLSPAGDMESLKAAIHAGCDAIYIGGKKFGARKFATNFDNDGLKEAVKYCHLYGVKLYVTLNTMIYENEVEDAINYAGYLHEIGVDAIIIQDIGLIRILRLKYPNLELHASTQLHNYTKENFELLKELGATRVVLARECSLEEIKNIDTTLEKEAFIHGAICISYSGQCLFSSIILNRSGNRGECAGMCRLPYKLKIGEKIINTPYEYLLSPKELSTLELFKELMESDITSFKIEGRMKSPNYVYYVTKLYRNLIDKYNNNENLNTTNEEIKNLSTIYNREFTKGKIFKSANNDFMNMKSPNHIGIHLGNVIDVNNKQIKIKLDEDINQEDGIRFISDDKGMIVNFLYNEKGLLINSAKKDSIIYVDNKLGIKNVNQEVRKTIDKKLNDSILNYTERKIPINMYIELYNNKEILLTVSDGINKVSANGIKVESAKNREVTNIDIERQLSKLGNTPFILNELTINKDENIFVPIGEINQIRRYVIDNLTSIRENSKKEIIVNELNNTNKEIHNYKTKLTCLVRNKEQLEAISNYDLERIYITDEELYNEYKDKINNLYLRVERVKKHKEYVNERLLVTELANLYLKNNNRVVTDYYLNVANSSYLEYLKNVEGITLSVEAKSNNLYDLAKLSRNYPLEVLVYGRIELMIMRHCILNTVTDKDFNCNKCNLCDNKCLLIDRNNKEYPIIANHDKINHILNYESKILDDSDVKYLINGGIKTLRIELYDEKNSECKKIIEKYLELIQKQL